MEDKQLYVWIHAHDYMTRKKGDYTHTDLSRSASAIRAPPESMDRFHQLYCQDLLGNLRHYLSETAEPNSFRLFFDLDILMPLDVALDEGAFLRPMMRVIHGVVGDFFGYLGKPALLKMFVMTRYALRKESGLSCGYHVHFPHTRVSQQTMGAIRSVSTSSIFRCYQSHNCTFC